VAGLKKEEAEIRVAWAKLIYRISRIAPSFALKKIFTLVRRIEFWELSLKLILRILLIDSAFLQ
jgi:hypothetical protein